MIYSTDIFSTARGATRRSTDSYGPRHMSRTYSIFTEEALWRRSLSISSTTLTLTENRGTSGLGIPWTNRRTSSLGQG